MGNRGQQSRDDDEDSRSRSDVQVGLPVAELLCPIWFDRCFIWIIALARKGFRGLSSIRAIA